VENKFYNAFDTERMAPESAGQDYRSAFQVDRDRVLHTPGFRSLQSKTQVFWSGEYDFYRTRLTHSLEVAQIGRSVCHWLKHSSELLNDDYFIDPDLVEASCLSHDLGHPPYGHAGERSLNVFMENSGGFEGNAQTLRLLTERIFSSSKKGMNPTRAFLDGVLKYKTLWSELKMQQGKAPKNHFIYDSQNEYLEWVFGGRDFPIELTPGKVRDHFRSIECQIMDFADDTAYSLNDVSDSVRAGFLPIERIEAWAAANDYSLADEEPLGQLLSAIRAGKVEPMVGRKIGKYINSTSLREDVNFMSAVTNRYHYVLEIDPAVQAEQKVFKRLAYDVVFLTPQLNQLEYKGDQLLSTLWSVLKTRYVDGEGHFNLLSDSVANEITGAEDRSKKLRLLCDFMATLTDSQASRLYKRLTMPDFGSIGDLV